MNTIKKIIHQFLYHSMPEGVQDQFQRWCLNRERAVDKEEAMWAEWNELDPTAVLPRDDAGYRRKLERLHREIMPVRSAMRPQLSWRRYAAVAALVAVVMCAEFLVVKHFAADKTTWLVTAENSKGRFTLPDGSTVWLNADSRLAYSDGFTKSAIRAVQLEGEAYFEVKHDASHPFEVKLGALKVRVLGTKFNASHIAAFDTEEVTLQSGRVEVSGFPSNRPVILSPDQTCSYNDATGEVSVSRVAANNYYSWTGSSIVFDNRPLSDIITNLEHWYNVRFQIDPSVDTEMRISFTLRPETLDETLRIMETLTYLHCRQMDKHYIRIYK